MAEFYSRTETELMMTNMEQRIDNKLDRIVMMLENMNVRIDSVEHRLDDLRGVVTASNIATTVTLIIALLGLVLPIAWQLWANVARG